MQLYELDQAKKELIYLKDLAKIDRVKNYLQVEIETIEKDISQHQEQKKSQQKDEAPKQPAKIIVDIKEHAFDESDKFVKLFIPFDASKIKEEDVEFTLTEDSFLLIIHEGIKYHQFKATSLVKNINMEKSYKKVKKDMISIYLKKAKEGETWGYLTKTEKHLKDQKAKMFDKKDENSGDDPSNALMSMMKKMYETGDPEMKRTIAKAMSENQDKSRNNQQMPFM